MITRSLAANYSCARYRNEYKTKACILKLQQQVYGEATAHAPILRAVMTIFLMTQFHRTRSFYFNIYKGVPVLNFTILRAITYINFYSCQEKITYINIRIENLRRGLPLLWAITIKCYINSYFKLPREKWRKDFYCFKLELNTQLFGSRMSGCI